MDGMGWRWVLKGVVKGEDDGVDRWVRLGEDKEER